MLTMHETLVVAIIGVFAAAFGGTGFWNWLASIRKKPNVFQRLTMAYARDRLNFLCKKHIKEGFIPDDEYESFKEMGEAYIAADGNTIVKKLFEDAMKLPINYDN